MVNRVEHAAGLHATHMVLNQPPPLVNYNAFTQDQTLMDCVRSEGADWAEARLTELGALVGSEEAIDWGQTANTSVPVLRTHDRYGQRIDEVAFHPAWHELLQMSVKHGAHSLSWRQEQSQGNHVARAAIFYLCTQAEAGHGCPISMTHAAYPVLRAYPEVTAPWLPLLITNTYDPGLRPAQEKRGLLCGMGMTEKQGGSDVRANTTQARPVMWEHGEPAYVLTGHKWFCSAPMSDLFLVLAQAPGGLTCFLLPRILPDGTRNNFFLQRLKDKLGNRSNASSEVEFVDAWALRLGEEGRGVRTIIEMVNCTRLDCVLGTAALMRQGVTQAIHHATYREAFGRCLLEQPLMRNVLADMAIESDAATILAFRLAHACDQSRSDAHESLIQRLGTAIAKYWVTKRGPQLAAEALECLGGNGYVEESGMPRLYREMPVNSVWEGSGNVICLDVLRSISKDPQALDAFLAEIARGRCADQRLDRASARFQHELVGMAPEEREWQARRLVERMALLWQASLLVQHAPSEVADAFCASRLAEESGHAFGTLPAGVDVEPILTRAWSAL
ncbi:isovaleryl-CoA dehydrogenase [Dictyobacter aurantiacus]|uniref:Acyl-CoA dehydrogenase n=1 Tax=Dictyobacter aurantiacus TaxID=1936993 RepID=A0A401Z869_9CHLR|nr:isovaleryl-CoA dehydrogenase [Dictyobacter aurantiacus]GCE03035.1 acyl-CoA dehydrogenase [Dictyobacter aurantiacus]